MFKYSSVMRAKLSDLCMPSMQKANAESIEHKVLANFKKTPKKSLQKLPTPFHTNTIRHLINICSVSDKMMALLTTYKIRL